MAQSIKRREPKSPPPMDCRAKPSTACLATHHTAPRLRTSTVLALTASTDRAVPFFSGTGHTEHRQHHTSPPRTAATSHNMTAPFRPRFAAPRRAMPHSHATYPASPALPSQTMPRHNIPKRDIPGPTVPCHDCLAIHRPNSLFRDRLYSACLASPTIARTRLASLCLPRYARP